jgi:hypothetical protein
MGNIDPMILAIGSCGYKMIKAMTPMAPAPTEETATRIPRMAPTITVTIAVFRALNV